MQHFLALDIRKPWQVFIIFITNFRVHGRIHRYPLIKIGFMIIFRCKEECTGIMTNFIPICIVPRLVEIGPFSGLWLWKKARFRTVFAFMLFSSFDRRTDDGRMKGNPKSLIRESSIRVILKVWNLSNNSDTELYCRAK